MTGKTNKFIDVAMLIAVFATLLSYSSQLSAMETFVEKIYDDKVTYTPAEFENEQNEDGHFFTRPCPSQQEPTQQCLLLINNGAKEFVSETELRYENILMKVNPGRVRVEDTKRWPYSIHAQLSLGYNNDIIGGSGVLISSHHVLTAAHNVYKAEREKKWADSIKVYPGLNGKAAIFGRAKATRVCTFREWIDNENPHYDCAIIVLDHPIGLHTGWGGLFGSEDVEEIISKKTSITGYPGDKGCDQMWTMKHKIKNVEAETFSYEIDTYEGQSGSGIWTLQGNDPYIMGIHTLGHHSMNYGVRLSRDKFDRIVGWLTKTRNFERKPVDIPIPLIAQGHEEIYLRFLKGKLVYRPKEGSDVGKVELPIARLANPLGSTFDLSQCGDADIYLSISTGCRTGKKTENEDKLEIWVAPRFLVEKEIGTTASHLKDIFSEGFLSSGWSKDIPLGIFWNSGSWNDMRGYDYLTRITIDKLSKNLEDLHDFTHKNRCMWNQDVIPWCKQYTLYQKRFMFLF